MTVPLIQLREIRTLPFPNMAKGVEDQSIRWQLNAFCAQSHPFSVC